MSSPVACPYGDVRLTNLSFDEAIARLEDALKAEGFGVLSRIDIQAKLKEKLGVDFPRYIILGACNPPLAHQGLQAEFNLGLLLPCNAVVYEKDSAVYAGVIDAPRMLSVTDRPDMDAMARQVKEKLQRALDVVAPRSPR